MKTTSYLARFAALAFAGFAFAIVLDFGVITFFSLATAAVVLVSAAGDYAPRRPAPRVPVAVTACRPECMPLAA